MSRLFIVIVEFLGLRQTAKFNFFLNFVMQGFRFYDILAVLSGEKEERKTASCGNGIIYA